MSPELDKQLCDKYPALFRDRHELPEYSAMSFGFECGDGWYNLIDDLCHCIETHIKSKWHQDELNVTVDQVKEKFGALRFYVTGSDYMIDGMICMAEYMSSRICEECGDKGHLRYGGWIKTACDKHANQFFGE